MVERIYGEKCQLNSVISSELCTTYSWGMNF